jgi:calmodulin-lysine N-methyltransferase
MMKNCDPLPVEEIKSHDNTKSAVACDNKSHKVAKVPKKENSNAKNRWRLLARAILSRDAQELKVIEKLPITTVSDDFNGFDLVQVEQMSQDDKETFTIKLEIECNKFQCNVHIAKLWTMKDLIGFNNTGNIKFWASEAALTYFALDNLPMFTDSWVLELGGGMFCLAGLMVAKYSGAFAVHLTDGNNSSLNNVRKSISLNESRSFLKSSGR